MGTGQGGLCGGGRSADRGVLAGCGGNLEILHLGGPQDRPPCLHWGFWIHLRSLPSAFAVVCALL